jgi:hypothetical protein
MTYDMIYVMIWYIIYDIILYYNILTVDLSI